MKRKVFLAAMALMLLVFAPALTACGTDDAPVAVNPAVPPPNLEQPGATDSKRLGTIRNGDLMLYGSNCLNSGGTV